MNISIGYTTKKQSNYFDNRQYPKIEAAYPSLFHSILLINLFSYSKSETSQLTYHKNATLFIVTQKKGKSDYLF